MAFVALRFLRDRTLTDLKKKVPVNLPLYRKTGFGFLKSDASRSFESPVEIADNLAALLKVPKKKDDLYDVENCEVVYRNMRHVTPYVATDERMWAMLSHTVMLDYARARWPIPADDNAAVKHISTHFFAWTQRQLERDNAASRLWWIAHICSRVDRLALKKALTAFLYRSDVRANIIERPTTAASDLIFSELIKLLSKSYDGDKKLFERAQFRRAMVRLNGYGGYHLLDAMDAKPVQALLTRFATEAPAK